MALGTAERKEIERLIVQTVRREVPLWEDDGTPLIRARTIDVIGSLKRTGSKITLPTGWQAIITAGDDINAALSAGARHILVRDGDHVFDADLAMSQGGIEIWGETRAGTKLICNDKKIAISSNDCALRNLTVKDATEETNGALTIGAFNTSTLLEGVLFDNNSRAITGGLGQFTTIRACDFKTFAGAAGDFYIMTTAGVGPVGLNIDGWCFFEEGYALKINQTTQRSSLGPFHCTLPADPNRPAVHLEKAQNFRVIEPHILLAQAGTPGAAGGGIDVVGTSPGNGVSILGGFIGGGASDRRLKFAVRLRDGADDCAVGGGLHLLYFEDGLVVAADDCQIEGLHADQGSGHGVLIDGARNGNMTRGNHIKGMGGDGVHFNLNAAGATTPNFVLGNNLAGNTGDGIRFAGLANRVQTIFRDNTGGENL